MLARPRALFFVDALDALACEAGRRNQGLDRGEVLAIIKQGVEERGDVTAADNDILTG